MAAGPSVSEGRRICIEWDLLQGLLTKPPPLPCLQNLRKEKSRNAARSRRGKENFEFFELAKMLPLPGAITSQLDKASVIRLTISYLRMRDFSSQGDPPWSPLQERGPHNKAVGRTMSSVATDVFEQHLGGHLLQSLDGFVFVVSHDGRFLYISETVSIYLGLSQVELTGSSVFDYIHPADHVEMAERLGMRPHLQGGADSHAANESASSSASTSSLAEAPEPEETLSPLCPEPDPLERSFFIRMKSTLTKRGLHVKSSGYKVIHVTGRLHSRPGSSSPRTLGLVALAHTLPPSTLSEVRMESHMFVFRVNLDLQVTYCENRISDYMDLSPAEVIGHSCYRFVHVQDLDRLRQSHEDLLRKGQVVTGYYRWLQRRGGFLWVQSCATVSINMKTPHDRNIIWVNYVLSRAELPDTPLDIQQLPERLRPERTTPRQHPKGSPSLQRPDCSGSGSEARETFLSDSPSDERRKRSRRHASGERPPEARKMQPDLSSVESDAEDDVRRDYKRLKAEEGQCPGTGEEEEAGLPKGCVATRQPNGTSPPRIKTEREPLAGPRSRSPAPSRPSPPAGPADRGCPPTGALSPETPPRSLFTPASPALCPPPGPGRDQEALHRLALPPALGAQGPQSLFAPSTIRYAPAEGVGLGAPAHLKAPPSLFPLPPFSSGFGAPCSPFPPILPFCVNGLRGTAARKEED
nr:PREDICTED: neuronal PAS domain-containing protein 1 isoform X1 [Lepisosteus oculatus]XP_015196457.1 PREDICTED: neuronal PAS domain-containing protein 1 isoform X1 [Lepisosteus oculatus]